MKARERWTEFALLILPLAVAIGALLVVDTTTSLGSWLAHLAGKLISAIMVVCIVAAIFRFKDVQLERDQLTGWNGVVIYSALVLGMSLVVAFA